MQTLYEHLQRGGDIIKIAQRNAAKHDFEKNNIIFIKKVAAGVKQHLEEIDKVITVSAPEWPLSQIAQVDLSILRLALFELLFDDEVPPKAVINEAVELGKAFGGENTSKFVNGVLGTVYRNSQKYQEEEGAAKSKNTTTPAPAKKLSPKTGAKKPTSSKRINK